MTTLYNIIAFFICFLSVIVILVKNPIHSILFLILVFSLVSCLLILLNLDFLAMIFLIIYIGAISVLFLFIIMMLNIRMIEIGENENKFKYLPFSFIFLFLVLFQFFFLIYNNDINFVHFNIDNSNLLDLNTNLNYLEYLALMIYVYFKEYFLVCGLILFVAMIGVIALTLNLHYYSKKQDLFLQINRSYFNTLRKKIN